MKKKEKIFKQNRKLWYRGIKTVMKIRYKRPQFVFLGEKPTNGAIILSNHEGTDAPMSLEIYCDFPVRFWGAHEMNSGLKKLYSYQTKVYYHEKKHWNLFLARLFCLIASPLTLLFYKGLKLISTYKDARLKNTLTQSFNAISQGENVVIFPENSEDGYLPELKGFFAGFVLLANYCEKQGINVPIFVSYYKKKENKYIFDSPIMFDKIKEEYKTKEEIADYLLRKCNNLGKLS
ncbi:MAG: hypothetical protein E7373_06330 [Clostridiales bacterium]|nr:hypothetical protein [Clostridiales bacterium]